MIPIRRYSDILHLRQNYGLYSGLTEHLEGEWGCPLR